MENKHPALDLLNTVSLDAAGNPVDVLPQWLNRAGYPASALHAAQELRDTLRTLVEKRKAGRRADPSALNAFLAQSESYLVLAAGRNGTYRLERKWSAAAPPLAPLAEAAAELLATADFALVRRCENPDCVLWFQDRTRSHGRRWCSMATCGNRRKVAAYRSRQM